MDNYIPSRTERAAVRRAAGLTKHDNPPVVVQPGGAAPALLGERGHFKTRNGTWINHPHAYNKVGWSNMVYCPSSRRVEVGADWLRGTENLVMIRGVEVGVAA